MSARAIVRAHRREQERSRRRAEIGRRLAAGTVATLAAGAIAAPGAGAATFSVTNLNDSGTDSLRQAILDADGAAGADTITFQSGLSGTINVAGEMAISDDLTIDGPGSGVLTLDGGDADRIFNGSNAVVSISGLTLANGDSPNDGGAAEFRYGSLTLDDVIVTGSQAGGYGGGIYLYGNDVTITNSRFSGNQAGSYGGGFCAYGSFPVAPTDAISITGSTFTGNQSGSDGGGIALYDNRADVTIDNSTIANNTVTGSGAGGGIWFEDTYDGHSTTVSDSTVTGNSAPQGGAGVSFGENFYGPAAVINSTITANTTPGNGGGVNFASMDQSSGVPFTLIDSTVTGNQAAVGGGVFRGYANGTSGSDSPLEVSSSVVAGNTATGTGPDFGVGTYAHNDLTLGNVFAGDVTGVTYTADPSGSNIIGGDPMLGPLADNGGPTETRLPEPGSPLIDAGLANGLSGDQRGEQRTVDYPDVPATHGSDGTDIGATELAPPPPDNEVTDPYLAITSPQEQGNKKIKVEVVAGAGEPVTAQVWGKIWIGKGNAVAKTERIAVPTDGRTTVTVNPKKNKATRRILKALANGRKVTAKLTGKLADEAGNEYQQDLQAKLKPKQK